MHSLPQLHLLSADLHATRMPMFQVLESQFTHAQMVMKKMELSAMSNVEMATTVLDLFAGLVAPLA